MSRAGETFVAEDGGTGVAEVGIDELAGNDAVAEECFACKNLGVCLALGL